MGFKKGQYVTHKPSGKKVKVISSFRGTTQTRTSWGDVLNTYNSNYSRKPARRGRGFMVILLIVAALYAAGYLMGMLG